LCTVRLADAGARVIKIERAGGETARHYDSAVHGSSTYFTWLNRGKESAVLDLKGDDVALLRRMLAKADVLVQNFAPGAMERMGLSDAALARDFPQLIALSIRGYGADTDYADMRAYDMLVQAEAGIASVTGTPEVPSKAGVPVADLATGSSAHAAILEALIARGRTGLGCQIEISMFDVMADWMGVSLLHFEHGGTTTARLGLSHATIYPYRPFKCQDGTIIVAVQNHAEWRRFCIDAFGVPDLADDPRYDRNEKRDAKRAELDAVLEPVFAALTFEDARAKCVAANIAWARYSELPELSAHPALRRTEVTSTTGETVTIPRPAGRGALDTKKLPRLGQHTDAIRREFS